MQGFHPLFLKISGPPPSNGIPTERVNGNLVQITMTVALTITMLVGCYAVLSFPTFPNSAIASKPSPHCAEIAPPRLSTSLTPIYHRFPVIVPTPANSYRKGFSISIAVLLQSIMMQLANAGLSSTMMTYSCKPAPHLSLIHI